MKKILIHFAFAGLCIALMPAAGVAQKIYTKNGSISFFSKSPLEDITAKNNEVTSVLDQQSGAIQFSVLIKSFRFRKSLMEQHFNENYMESDKFPKAIFKGRIDNLSALNFSNDGTYKVTVSGELTMHGVTNKITAAGRFTVNKTVVSSQSEFNINLSDYRISIPAVVRNNIAKTIAVSVSCIYDQKL